MTSPTPSLRPDRDARLDFWRGLCLVDMLLVHLVQQGIDFGEPLGTILGEYIRFAAGGFIFVSGFSIGRIFLPRAMDKSQRWQAYRAIWRRALYVLLVHYAAEISFLLRYPLLAGEHFPGVARPVFDVLLFRNGCDLLPFYVIMLALTPPLLELMRRGGWYVVAGLSALAFGLGRIDPYAGALPIQQVFLVPLWQVLFVAGLLFGAALPRYDAWTPRRKLALAVGMWTAMAVVLTADYGPQFGLELPLSLVFWKVPLTVGEVLRYLTMVLSLMLASDLLWLKLERRWTTGWVGRLGRHSLAAYVAHVWIVAVAVYLVRQHEWAGPRCLLLAAGALAALGLLARLLDSPRPRARPRLSPLRLIPAPFNAPVAGAIVALVALACINALTPVPATATEPPAPLQVQVRAGGSDDHQQQNSPAHSPTNNGRSGGAPAALRT